MVRKVELVPNDPKWPFVFEDEARALAGLFSSQLIAIYHIGSTAIPGIYAKPVIDILIEVKSIDMIDALDAAMQALDYAPRGEHGIPGRRYFSKEINGIHTHHVHIFAQGHPEIARHIRFCDYLRANPEEARAYSQLKRHLAQIYPEDAESYTEAKSPFMRTSIIEPEPKRRAGKATRIYPPI